MKTNLHQRIFIGMFVGLAVGLALNALADPDSALYINSLWWLDLLGKTIFVGGLKMIIAPLIFASIVAGISTLPNIAELGSIGGKTFIYYFSTTTIAVAIGIAAVLIVRPGEQAASQNLRAEREAQLETYREAFVTQSGLDTETAEGMVAFRRYIDEREDVAASSETRYASMTQASEQSALDMFKSEILIKILENPFHSLAQSPPNSLGVIFFAILTGLACLALGEQAKPVTEFFQSFNKIMMTITLWLMEIAPVAIGCLIASVVASLGLDALQSLGWYCITVIGGIFIHCMFLLFLVRVIGGMSPLTFIRGIRDAWLIAFSSTSSAATLPVTIHCTTKKLGVSEKVADFSLPVGATVNMDGTALYEGVAIIFMIQMYGGLTDVPIELTAAKTGIIFVTAVLASIGAAAVPSAGLITMAIVATAVGLPLYYIFIIFAVDHMLDMFRTSTNVMGDMVGAVIVNRLEQNRLEKPAA